jgi:hypothetical protein
MNSSFLSFESEGLEFALIKGNGGVITAIVTGLTDRTPTDLTIPETVKAGDQSQPCPSTRSRAEDLLFNEMSQVSGDGQPAVYPVIGIDDKAFFGLSYILKSVILPPTLKYIGAEAFFGCASLTDINFPDSLKYIGAGAFESCSSLTDVTICSPVISIKERTFCDCTSLNNVTFSETLETIYNKAFYGCTSLSDITLPDSLKSIGDKAFAATSLGVVYSQSLIPPILGTNVFPDDCQYCPPSESLSTYQDHPQWKAYRLITT